MVMSVVGAVYHHQDVQRLRLSSSLWYNIVFIYTNTPVLRDTAMTVLQIVRATAALGRTPLLKALSWTYVMMDSAPAKASSQAGWI